MKYVVDIENYTNDLFELNSDNVLTLKVYDSKNELQKDCHVEMFLTKNAMLGLGTELIRLAHDFHEGKHFHLDPCEKDLIVQTMGVYVEPSSSSLVISCDKNQKIDDILK